MMISDLSWELILIGNIVSTLLFIVAGVNLFFYKKYLPEIRNKNMVQPIKGFRRMSMSKIEFLRQHFLSVFIGIYIIIMAIIPHILSFYYTIWWTLIPAFSIFLMLCVVANIYLFIGMLYNKFSITIRSFFLFLFLINLASIHLVLQVGIVMYNQGFL